MAMAVPMGTGKWGPETHPQTQPSLLVVGSGVLPALGPGPAELVAPRDCQSRAALGSPCRGCGCRLVGECCGVFVHLCVGCRGACVLDCGAVGMHVVPQERPSGYQLSRWLKGWWLASH